jgi:hypothetical protein
MPLKLNSSGGGSVTLDTPSTASTYTLTVPAITGTAVVTGSSGTVSQGMLASGVAGNGPAFSVYATANTTFTSSTFTKVTFPTEDFDTNSNYDTATSRFTPTVAGYYQINAGVYVYSNAGTTSLRSISLYKNGGAYKRGTFLVTTPPRETMLTFSGIVYCNGSTDYLEMYVYDNGTSPQVYGGGVSVLVWFDGSLARAA